METAAQAWDWLGGEIAEFGIRWLLVTVVMLGFGGWFGWRYRELKRDVANLKAAAAKTEKAPNITVNVGDQTKQVLPPASGATGTVAEYVPNRNVVRINTKAGLMEIRTWYGEHAWQDDRMTEDVLRILDRNGVLRPLDNHK